MSVEKESELKSAKDGIQVVLGTMTFGWSKSSEECNDTISQAMIQKFIANQKHVEIDTAFVYSGGETEKILGRVLPKISGANRIEIATKAAPWLNLVLDKVKLGDNISATAGGLSPKYVRFQLESSLERMQLKQVQIFYLHAPDVDSLLLDTLTEVKKLHEEKKFIELGLSNFSAWETVQVYYLCMQLKMVLPTVYQGLYNPISRAVEVELLPALRRLNIRFLCYNPLAGGLLAGKHDFSKEPPPGRFDKNQMYLDRYWRPEYFKALAEVQAACAEAKETSLASVSFRWLKCHSQLRSGDGIIIGASSIKHLDDNCLACDDGQPLADSIVQAIDKAWLVCKPVCPKYFRP
jgi:aflatoxin B1 aldehyde reductase